MEVRLVKREDIEKVKWDSCVHYANMGNMFGYAWYLDNVAKEWDGLVEGDYESVMPLIKKDLKGAVQSLYIPDLLPKSGLYSIYISSPSRLSAFLNAIPEEYQIRNIPFTTSLPLRNVASDLGKDYELSLRDDYISIFDKYSDELKKGIDVVEKKNLLPDSAVKPEEMAEFYFKNNRSATDPNKHAYLRIMYNLLHRGTGFISGIRDENKNLLAADFFGYSHGKVVSLIPSYKGELGKFALWRLTDMIIQTHSGKPSILDFNTQMGDINPAIFGAEKVSYSIYKENTLKGWKKWLIK